VAPVLLRNASPLPFALSLSQGACEGFFMSAVPARSGFDKLSPNEV